MSVKDIAESVIAASQEKARATVQKLLLLGFLAGAYIGFGAMLSIVATQGVADHLGSGLARIIAGSVFSLGLVLVVVAGAELFTGNCLMVLGVLSGKVSIKGLLRNWTLVYLANFAGSLFLVGLIYHSGLWKGQEISQAMVRIAASKVNMTFLEAFCRGVGCNWLVCLAIWLSVAGEKPVSKIASIYFPIMAFVALGFEHSVANMFFIPLGLVVKDSAIANLTWEGFLSRNLVPVSLGNIVGGGIFVGGIYYLVLRNGGPSMEGIVKWFDRKKAPKL